MKIHHFLSPVDTFGVININVKISFFGNGLSVTINKLAIDDVLKPSQPCNTCHLSTNVIVAMEADYLLGKQGHLEDSHLATLMYVCV